MPFCRYQLVQLDHEMIEFRYVPDGSGRKPDLPALSAYAREAIHPSVNLRVTEVERLPISASGKIEQFISNLPASNAPPRR